MVRNQGEKGSVLPPGGGSQDTVSPVEPPETKCCWSPAQEGKFRLLILVVELGAPGWKSLRTFWDKESLTLNLVLVPALAHPEPGPVCSPL